MWEWIPGNAESGGKNIKLDWTECVSMDALSRYSGCNGQLGVPPAISLVG